MRTYLVMLTCLLSASLQAAVQNSGFFAGEDLDQVTYYRVYPLVDRALREVSSRHYAAASQHLRQAQRLAPQSQAIRLSLARSLQAEQHFVEAESVLAGLDSHQSTVAELLLAGRLAQLQHGRMPDQATIVRWLDDCAAAQCSVYAEAIAAKLTQAQRSRQAQALTPWLARQKLRDPASAWRIEARLLSQLGEQRQAADAWHQAASARALSADETLAYGLSLLASHQTTQAARLLHPAILASKPGQILARNIAEKAVASNQPQLASQTYAALDQQQPVNAAQLERWLRSALLAADHVQAEKLLPRLQRLAQPDHGDLLLNTWATLDHWQAVADFTPDNSRVAALQNRLLLNHALSVGDYRQILQRVPVSSAASSSAYAMRLQALAALGQRDLLAQGWRARYQSTHAPSDLDKASFMLADNGSMAQAAALLQSALPFPVGAQSALLTSRLLNLYQAQPELASAQDLRQLGRQPGLSMTNRVALAELWRQRGACEPAQQLLETVSPLTPAAAMVLGQCYAGVRPGLAIAYFQHARVLAPKQTDRSLAYLHAATGWPALAVADWLRLPAAELTAADQIAAAQAALAANDLPQALHWWRAAQLDGVVVWHALGAQLAERQGDLNGALLQWQRVRVLQPENAAGAYAAGELLRRLQQPDAAIRALQEAVALEPANPHYRVALGYAQISSQPQAAATTLAQVHLPGASQFPVEETLSMLYAGQGDSAAARQSESRAMALAPDYLDQVPTDEAADRLYALKTLREGLDRRFSLGLSAWFANQAVPGELLGGSPVTGATPKNYLELSGEWRLGAEPNHNNRFIALTGRLFSDGQSGETWPGKQSWLGIGVRAKPFSSQNIYLSLEQLQSMQQRSHAASDHDQLVRISASFLDQGAWRPEWHASGRGWWQQQLYLDAAHWLHSDTTSLLTKYTIGYNHKLAFDTMTLQPYGLAQYQHTSSGYDSRAGLGLALRRFGRADPLAAYGAQQQIKLEWQHVLNSSLAQGNGWFLKLESAW